MKLVANMHKLCYEACIEKCDYCAWLSIVGMHYNGHVYHISMIPATPTFTEKQQLGAVLTNDNSQTETTPGIFSATEHIYTGLFTLSQPHHFQ